MRLVQLIILVASLFVHSSWASDACSERAIFTAADVQVSDGSAFSTQTWFRSAEAAAIRHIREENQIVVTEGPIAWISRGDKSRAGGDQLASFALGHQFHAMLLHFDEVASNTVNQTDIRFGGDFHPGISGDFKYGGRISLVQAANNQQPLGLVFELPDRLPMEITFSEWKNHEGTALPFHIRINDDDRIFEYAYTRIDLARKPLNWFFDNIEAPDIDELRIYRLHRQLLKAHCEGDADPIADLTAPVIMVSGRGSLQESSREETRLRFKHVFQRVDYHQYHDLTPPIIEVSQSGDIGWIGVNVLAAGKDISNNKPFEAQWSWIMLARKIDGAWFNAGNASNQLPPTPVGE